jgi:hypothetical protein
VKKASQLVLRLAAVTVERKVPSKASQKVGNLVLALGMQMADQKV